MSMLKGTVLIAGATGYLGRHLVKAYQDSGYHVRALARHAKKLTALGLSVDEIIIGEATKPETLIGCCEGVDLIISALGITRQKDGLTYEQVDYQANRNLLNEALTADVQRFAYVNVLNADRMTDVKMVGAKEKFARELKASAIASTIISPSGFFSDLEEIFHMAQRGRVYLFGAGEMPISPIHGADLASVCVGATEAGLEVLYAGGPEVLTQKAIALLAFKILGSAPRITHIPIWVGRMAARVANLFGQRSTAGALEFLLKASTLDMSAPPYGNLKLAQAFERLADARM